MRRFLETYLKSTSHSDKNEIRGSKSWYLDSWFDSVKKINGLELVQREANADDGWVRSYLWRG